MSPSFYEKNVSYKYKETFFCVQINVCLEQKREIEREGKRERYGEFERSSKFGEGRINGPSNRGRVGLLLKLDELL